MSSPVVNSDTKSLTSEFKGAHDNKCMCQICVCNNPNHVCPANYHKPYGPHKTQNQMDFQPHDAKKPDLHGMRDNLKFKKLNNNDTTEYKREYIKKEAHPGDQDMRDAIKKNNVDSHIKNLVGNKKEPGQELKRNQF